MKKKYYVCGCSFGRDSLALLLGILDKKMPLNEVIFCDMGEVEFDCVHELSDRIRPILEKNEIKFTILKPDTPFLYNMLRRPVVKRDGTLQTGYGWCGSVRWGTGLKLETIEKRMKELSLDYDVYDYVGIAWDERHRTQNNTSRIKCEHKLYPLVDWQMTQTDCLRFCRSKGYDWIENGLSLYDYLDHLSCVCCRNKSQKELRNIYKYFPCYFARLERLQAEIAQPFMRDGRTISDMRAKFEKESLQYSVLDFL